MGEFFTPTPPRPEHRCDLPWQWSADTHWRCDCGKAYRRERLGPRDRGVDPREPDWQWVRSPEHDMAEAAHSGRNERDQ